MKSFKTAEEERKFWLELARSKFWEEICDLLLDREDAILNMLGDVKIDRKNDKTLLGRLIELRWFRRLPNELLSAAELSTLVEEKEEVVEQQRLVGKPDKNTGVL